MTANGSGSFVEKRVRQYNPYNRRFQVATIGWSMRGREKDVDSRWLRLGRLYLCNWFSKLLNKCNSLSLSLSLSLREGDTPAALFVKVVLLRLSPLFKK